MPEIYELIIIGAGPAGITASVYAARMRMKFLILSRDVGGQAGLSADVENYTSYQFIKGAELAAKFEEHLRAYGVALKENESVEALEKKGDLILLESNKAGYQAKAVIIASGKRSRPLNVPGEKEFKNRGVSYCATCDGPLFADKTVAVIGGGNSALDAVLQLINTVRKLYLVNITSSLGGETILREKVMRSEKVSLLNNAQVTAISGDKMVNAVRVKTKEGEKNLPVEGVFVEIGLIPNSEFAKGPAKNRLGEIKVNCYNETSVRGIFAAGDVTDVPEKQIIIAAGEGAKAALGAFRYLSRGR